MAYYNRYPRRSKYGAKKIEIDGEIFDSKREAKRWKELKLMEDVGLIEDLRRQVKYVLIPAQREPDRMDFSKSARGKVIKGKVIEREVAYYADFVYLRDGKTVVEDAKGMRTEVYKLKRKLMLWVHDIQIKEV